MRGGIYMIAGPGGNTTVQIGVDGVLLVDPQPAASSGALLAEIAKLSDKPVRFVSIRTETTITSEAMPLPRRARSWRVGIRVPRRCIPAAAPPSGPTKTYWRG